MSDESETADGELEDLIAESLHLAALVRILDSGRRQFGVADYRRAYFQRLDYSEEFITEVWPDELINRRLKSSKYLFPLPCNQWFIPTWSEAYIRKVFPEKKESENESD